MASIASGANYYASTNGTGDGSFANPWPLSTAISNSTVGGGDTVWVRGSTVRTNPAIYITSITNVPGMAGYPSWDWWVSGSSTNNRATFRAYPNEFVEIDGRHRVVGTNICFWGLGFFNSLKGIRNTNDLDPLGDFNAVYPHFVVVPHAGHLWINPVTHDIDDGGFASQADGGNEIRGMIAWYQGWNYREHMFYPMVSDCSGSALIWMLNRGVEDTVNNFSFNSNIVAGSGAQWKTNTSAGKTNGNGTVTEGGVDVACSGHTAKMIGNVFYSFVSSYSGGFSNGSVISNNIFHTVGLGSPVGNLGFSSNSVFVNNTNYMLDNHGDILVWSGSFSNTIDRNAYYGTNDSSGSPVNFLVATNQGTQYQLGPWRSFSGFDLNSTTNIGVGEPDGYTVIPNADEPRRAHVAIRNWTKQDNVSVSMAGVLNAGDTYQIIDMQNYPAGPIRTGTYNGTSVSFPMTNLTVVTMRYGTNVNYWGEILNTPPALSPSFGAFLVVGQAAAIGNSSSMQMNGGMVR